MFGFLVAGILGLLYFLFLTFWVCALGYSLFVYKGKKRVLCPLLTVICVVAAIPLLRDSTPIPPKVNGIYHGGFGSEKDTLTLRPDGSFSQQFVTTSGKAYTMEGHWVLNSLITDEGDYTLSLDHVIVGIGKGGKRLSSPLRPTFINGSVCFWKKDQGSNDEVPENCFTQ